MMQLQTQELQSGIYCIENIINHKKYVGQSIRMNQRWSKHKSELKHVNHDNDYLQKSWNKYGEENFTFYILEFCDRDQLDERESYYIDLYNTLNRDYGYNLKSGGQATNCLSEEVKNKISKSNKMAYANSNLKKQRSIDALNQWANPEIKAKITGENNGMYGKHHTDETRKKMSDRATGRRSTQRNSTPVLCVELNKRFADACEAAKEFLCQSGTILQVCRGKRKTCAGYHWQFITENNIC